MRAPTLSTVRFAVLVAIVLALFVSGVVVGAGGAPLILGQANGAGGLTTSVTSAASGPTLTVANSSSGVPLKLTAPSGKAPLAVNRTARVKNLNADRVDGLDASAFLRSSSVTNSSVSGLGAGTLVVKDPHTGAAVRTASSGGLAIKNTSAGRDLVISGICAYASYMQSFALTLAPGDTTELHCYAVRDTYFDVALLLQGATVKKTRFSHLTCSFQDSSTPAEVVRSCLVVG